MGDLTAEAIAKIEVLTRKPFTVPLAADAHIVYVPDGFKALKADEFRVEPKPPVLQLATLTGLRDYLHANRDQLDLATLMVNVESPIEVTAFVPVHGPVKQRDSIVKVSCNTLVGGAAFQFGTFYDLETFNIALQALFLEENDRAAVLKLVGSVREEGVRTADDNGITQVVTAKAGVVLNAEARVPNPVVLRPWRTFREVQQPASLFVLRLQKGREGELPKAALFEADGGKWKLEACQSIAEWLTTEVSVLGVTILA